MKSKCIKKHLKGQNLSSASFRIPKSERFTEFLLENFQKGALNHGFFIIFHHLLSYRKQNCQNICFFIQKARKNNEWPDYIFGLSPLKMYPNAPVQYNKIVQNLHKMLLHTLNFHIMVKFLRFWIIDKTPIFFKEAIHSFFTDPTVQS